MQSRERAILCGRDGPGVPAEVEEMAEVAAFGGPFYPDDLVWEI